MISHSLNRVNFATLLLCGVISSSAFMTTDCLGSNKQIHHGIHRPRRHRILWEGSSTPEITNPVRVAKNVDDTIQSLQRLLARQQADVESTKQLLNSLSQTNRTNISSQWNQLPLSTAFHDGFDYGFVSRSEGGTYPEFKGDLPAYMPPANVWTLGWGQFWRNWDAIKGKYRDEVERSLTTTQKIVRTRLRSLTLDSKAIWDREGKSALDAPTIVKLPYLALCWFLDVVFDEGYVFSRFFFLETVARMPYFSYISMIHLYETLGFWRRSADAKRIHFAEELNEYRHLLIAESLGGDQEWWVRFLAQHSAIVYYIGLCILWLLSPSLSYEFSKLLETHAVNTYGQFLDENEDVLKQLPPPLVAIEYYCYGASDPFYAEFQIEAISNKREIRRPGQSMTSLFEVFRAIQADEADHVSAMKACLDPNVALVSPSIERKVLTAAALIAALGIAIDGNDGLGIATGGITMDNVLSDGILGATTGLGAMATQIMGESADGAAGGTYGTELLEESMISQKFFSSFLGGLGAILGLTSFSESNSKGLPPKIDSLESDEWTDGNCTRQEPIDDN